MTRYFISYSHQDGNRFGTGNCTIDLQLPIRDMDDIHAVIKILRGEGIANPLVLSFCRFDDDAEAGTTR